MFVVDSSKWPVRLEQSGSATAVLSFLALQYSAGAVVSANLRLPSGEKLEAASLVLSWPMAMCPGAGRRREQSYSFVGLGRIESATILDLEAIARVLPPKAHEFVRPIDLEF